jgi:hypothetical protein
VSAEPDPKNTNPNAGIAVTMAKDITGEDVAQRWHALCRQRDAKRRSRDGLPEPSQIDWEAQIREVLAEAEDTA